MGKLAITQGQRQYIESLLAQLGYSIAFALSEGLSILPMAHPRRPSFNQLTRKEASELIDWLVEEKNR